MASRLRGRTLPALSDPHVHRVRSSRGLSVTRLADSVQKHQRGCPTCEHRLRYYRRAIRTSPTDPLRRGPFAAPPCLRERPGLPKGSLVQAQHPRQSTARIEAIKRNPACLSLREGGSIQPLDDFRRLPAQATLSVFGSTN